MYNLNEFIKNMPKVELHVHLEGSIRPDTASYLFNCNHQNVDPIHIKGLYRYGNLKNFIRGMQKVSDNIKTPDHLGRIARELLETLALQQVMYVEFDCALQKYKNLGLSIKEILDTIYKNVIEAKEHYQIESRMIVNLQRSFGAQSAMDLVQEIVKLDHPLVVGIGLSGYENTGSMAEFRQVYKFAKQNNLSCTVHAGEIGGPESIWQAITKLEIDRIDHGTQAIQDELLVEYLVKNNIPLTQCLTSNVKLNVCENLQDHPFPQFYNKGVMVTLNTDDPEVFGVSLTGEYQKAASYFNLREKDMMNIVLNGLKASFMNDDEKKQYSEFAQQKFSKLFKKQPSYSLS